MLAYITFSSLKSGHMPKQSMRSVMARKPKVPRLRCETPTVRSEAENARTSTLCCELLKSRADHQNFRSLGFTFHQNILLDNSPSEALTSFSH